MKKIFSLCMLMTLLASSFQYSVVLAAHSDDEDFNFSSDSESSSESDSYDEIPASQKRLIYRAKEKKEKKSEKKSGKKSEKKSDGKGSGNINIIDTAQQAADFVQDHKDEIFQGFDIAQKVGDKIIGDGDGKLTPEEVLNFLKGIKDKLVKVKNLLGEKFKKKDVEQQPFSSDDQIQSPSDVVLKRGVKRAAVHMPQISLYPKSLSVQAIKDKLGDSCDQAKQLLGEVVAHFENLKDSGIEAVEQFLAEHEDLATMVNKLSQALDRSQSREMLEIGNLFVDLEKALPAIDSKVNEIKQETYVAVEDAYAHFANEDYGNSASSITIKEADDEQKDWHNAGSGAFDGIKLSVQQAGAVFGGALGYEDEDGKLTLADLPKIFAKIKEKIGSLQKLLGKIRKPKRGIGGVDDAVTVQIQAHILEVGKGLTQLANVLGVSEEEIRKIYKNMNIEQVSAFIANGTEKNEDLALAQQVAAYAKMIKDNKGKRVVIDPQLLGNSLKLTLDFVTQLQAMIPVADALSQQDQAFVGRFAGKVNWKKCGSYVGVAVTILGSVLALGEQQGWWDIYPN